jgi:hypothetical protein
MVVTSMDAFTELAIEAIAMLQLDINMMQVLITSIIIIETHLIRID